MNQKSYKKEEETLNLLKKNGYINSKGTFCTPKNMTKKRTGKKELTEKIKNPLHAWSEKDDTQQATDDMDDNSDIEADPIEIVKDND
jgi:hypothetical protein